ncbi:MAG: adenylosuccinate lyase, partial [Bacilli bacterium]|nr:adenylosuccinate lyase [Bacilli bacterium]MBN2696078.1 adenylosuccinate lyase [Bacilli bacterium]
SLLDYMLHRYTLVLNELVVNQSRMLENIESSYGIVYSQRVLTALIDKGTSREIAYDMMQKLTNQATRDKRHFREVLLVNKEISEYLDQNEIESLFDIAYYLRNVDLIFDRVFA